MIGNPFYTHEFHGDYDLKSIGRLDLEDGGSIPDCQLAVATWGELNEARDNAILITTWYSGTHQIWRERRHPSRPSTSSSATRPGSSGRSSSKGSASCGAISGN
jgi:homoserine acetyltransferase